LTKNAILTSAACAARPGGKVFYKTFDLTARKVPRATIVSLQKHRKAKRIKLKNKKGIGHQICSQHMSATQLTPLAQLSLQGTFGV